MRKQWKRAAGRTSETNISEFLLWEVDWRAERDCLLAELTAQKAAA